MGSLNISELDPPMDSELVYIGFNQDYGCFACGTENGFRIYNCENYRETFKREFSGGIGIVEMLYRCNILALVGGGQEPAYQKNKVILWDDHQATPIGELTFKTDVKAVKLRRDKIVVVLEKLVYVYNFEKLTRIAKYETTTNPKGIVAFSPSSDSCVLAFPHVMKGIVRVELLNSGKTQLISAHDSTISCIALNMNGTRLATASEKGTLIRIFDTETGNRLQEVRRGADRAEIYSIAFNHTSTLIAASSDKGTIHIFSLSAAAIPPENGGSFKDGTVATNRKSKMSVLGSALSYFSSEWSFAWYKGPECPAICAFGQDDKSVIVVTADGSFVKLAFDPAKGGECERKVFSRFSKKK